MGVAVSKDLYVVLFLLAQLYSDVSMEWLIYFWKIKCNERTLFSVALKVLRVVILLDLSLKRLHLN